MAQLVIAAAASWAGGALAAGAGYAAGAAVAFGMTGSQLGWLAGSLVGSALTPKQKSQGPRLNDLAVTTSAYGTPIPYVIGSPRLAGQVVWASTKREIATTTEQGKGGGAEYTSYTYEVDLLILLADNSTQGISRIWNNGELVYTRLDSATDDSTLASHEATLWRRLTFYDGDPAQTPDPTYEAAVGTANALAYRGRSTVMIEALQLGGSGQIGNLTFELYTGGTEVSGDYLTMLQTDFSDSSAADQSFYAIGAGTNTGGALGEGYYEVTVNTPAFKGQAWTHANIARPLGTDYTLELFFDVTNVAGAPAGFQRFANAVFIQATGFNLLLNGFGGAVPAANEFAYNDTINGGGHNYEGSTDFLNIATRHHFALVVTAAETYSWWLDGVRLGGPYATGSIQNSSGSLSIGGVSPSSEAVKYRFYGVRVRREQMYTGASFTPPTSPDDWGAAYRDFTTVIPDTLTVAQAVSEICLRAGMTADQFDVTGLSSITRPVRAMAIPLSSARTALEMLAGAYFFEAVLSDKLYFRPRGGAAVLTIPYADLGISNNGQFSDPLAIVDANEVELPAQIALTYHNVDGDYQTDTQYSDRLLSSLKSTSTLQLAIGMTASEAKQTADAMLVDGVVTLKSTTLSVDGTYTKLEPTDVVQAIGSDGSSYRVRLLQRKEESGVLTFDAVLDDASALTQEGVTAGATTPQTVVLSTPDTTARLLDIPLLRDDDDSPGYYIAVNGGSATNWRQAAVYESADDISYAQETTISSAATMGTATTALANWSGGNLWDSTSTVTVSVTGGELSSVTQLQAEARRSVNAALIGDELVQFRTATLVSPGVYTLSNFLRGRRSTEWAMSTHAIGDRFVLLSASGLRFVPLQLAELGGLRYVKAVTAGKLLSDATAQTITPLGVGLKPFSPVLASIDRTSGDAVIDCFRRTRLSSRITGPLAWSNPLGEASESYEIDVFSSGTYTTLKRTLTSSTSDVTYTAALQTTDFGAPPATLYLDIYQISASVGRGYKLRVAL